jgi:hypothetical protein
MAKYQVRYELKCNLGQTTTDFIVESRHSDKEDAEKRRDFCRKLLHKLNPLNSVEVTVESL